MKSKTLRQMVEEAREKGLSVQIKNRADGSLRVVGLNGRRFKGNSSKGNQELRSALGYSLSSKRRRQLRSIRVVIPKTIRKKYRAINEWLSTAKAEDKADGAQPISQKQISRIYRQRGYRETIKMLREYEKSVRPTLDQGTLEMWLDDVEQAVSQVIEVLGWEENTAVVFAARRLMRAVVRAKSQGVRKGAGADIRILRYNLTDIVDRMIREAAIAAKPEAERKEILRQQKKNNRKRADHRFDQRKLVDAMNALTEGLLNSLYKKK